jgi:hypothetical protein
MTPAFYRVFFCVSLDKAQPACESSYVSRTELPMGLACLLMRVSSSFAMPCWARLIGYPSEPMNRACFATAASSLF